MITERIIEPNNNIIILDRELRPNEIRVVKSLSELFGFTIENNTEQVLYIEPIFVNNVLKKLIIHK